MEIKLKTNTLKTLTNKVIKGMGNNKMLPITEMIGINIEGNTLSLLSTDGRNKVEVKATIENPDNFSTKIAINGNNFSKLIQKMTTENVVLDIEGEKLVIKGNGNYSFSLPADEDGNLVVFESLFLDGDEEIEADTNLLKESYQVNKESAATTLEIPAYTGFYFDENGSVATNSLKISYFSAKVFKNPVLLNSSFVQLFSLLDDEKVKIKENNSEIFIYTPTVSILGFKMPELTDFPITDIKPFIDTEMDHKVKVNKQALLNLLERISIFVTPYDKNGIKIDFTKEGLKVWTIKGDNNELLPYIDTVNFIEDSILVDVSNFKALVGSNNEQEVTIHYGNPNAIKMTFKNVTQIIALQEK